MRFLLLCLSFSVLGLCAFSQDHQSNRKNISRNLREVYDVLKSDWKIKDGQYVVLNQHGMQIVKGQYSKDMKCGIWNYYDNNGRLIQQYDFSHDNLIFQGQDTTTIVQDDFRIPAGVESTSKLKPPYKIGGPEYGFFLLYDDRDIPAAVKSNSGKAEMSYVLTIDEKGQLESYMVVFSGENFNDIVERRTVHGLSEEALQFSPAIVDGKPVRSQIFYKVPLDVDHYSSPGTNNIVTQHGAERN